MATRLHRPGRLIAVGAEVLLGAAVLALLGGWLLGWQLVVVTTGSMGESIPRGSLAVVVPEDRPSVGDVVSFTTPRSDDPVLHRIVEVFDRTPGPPLLQTKGDANRDVDPGVIEVAQVGGRAVWSVPVLGPVVRSLRGPGALLVMAAAGVAVFSAGRPRRAGPAIESSVAATAP